MSQTFYNYSFRLLNDSNEVYKLRKSEITAAQVLYRVHDAETTFTTTFDFNIDEDIDTLWVRLPSGDLDFVITLNVSTLRTITTGLATLTFGQLTTNYDVQATPVPLNSKQGYSPRILNDFWYEYDDVNQTFVNTGYSAKGTVIPETVQVDDFLLLGDVNPVTSNAVKVETNRLQSQITANENAIVQNSEAIQSLGEHKVSVTINDTTTTEDTAGNIALENIVGVDKLYKVQSEYDIASLDYYGETKTAILEQGGTELNGKVFAGSYGKYYTIPTGSGTYYRIMGTLAQTNPASVKLRISSGSNTIAGTVYIGMEDNISVVYCDNVLLQKYIYVLVGGSAFQGLFIKAMSNSMQIVQAYCSTFIFLDDTYSLYTGDTTLMVPVSYGLATNKTWLEVYDTPYTISQLESEIDLSVNIPAVTLTLPTDLVYPETIVVKNIQGAACTLSATGYTDLTLDDQTVNYITLTSATEWTKVSTANNAGAQGIKFIGKDTVYAIDAQGIINIPWSFQAANMGISFTSLTNTVNLANQYVELFLYSSVSGVVSCNFVGDANGSFSFNCPDVEDANFTFTYNGSALTYNGTAVTSKGKRTHIDVSDGVIVGMYTPSTGGSTGTGNVSTDGLTIGYLTKAVGAEKIGNATFTDDDLIRNTKILLSLLDGTITYQTDYPSVTNNVTKSANTPVTTAYPITAINSGSGLAEINVLNGNVFLLSTAALSSSFKLDMRYGDASAWLSHSQWLNGNTSIRSIWLPENGSIPTLAQAFMGMTSLRDVTPYDNSYKNCTSMWEAFDGCTALETFYGNYDNAATTWQEAFLNCTSLTYADLLGSGNENITSMYEAFMGCTALQSVDMVNFNFGTANCGCMFKGDATLSIVNLSGATLTNISSCHQMFYGCSSLGSIAFNSGSMFSVANNCVEMFAGCSSMTSLDISSFNLTYVDNIYNMLKECSALTSLIVPDGWNKTLDLGWSKNLSQTSIANLATKLATVTDLTLTFDATLYANIPSSVISTITGKGWSILTVTY